jgi:hypothetical protein
LLDIFSQLYAKMRLLHARTLKFEEFNESSLPPYAILSHTWNAPEEVSFEDMTSTPLPTKKGYAKITETCRLALSQGLEYAWIDTCCINKSSSAELTESINSMFRWYQNSRVCYVYLSDLHAASAKSPELDQCAWFGRGWTLQELLAPSNVEFYNDSWTMIGTKMGLLDVVSDITRIPVLAITGASSLKSFSTAQRMSWASHRVTTRTEDMAYCLLGLFDVHMPLVYGEGSKAFQRLQEEIIKRTFDPSLFAWVPERDERRKYLSVLAPSPAAIRMCSHVGPFKASIVEYSMTNRGLKVTGSLIASTIHHDDEGKSRTRYILPVGEYWPDDYKYGIVLAKFGPRGFVRLRDRSYKALDEEYESDDVAGSHEHHLGKGMTRSFHILTDVDSVLVGGELNRWLGIFFPLLPHIEITGDFTFNHWDSNTRVHSIPPLPYYITAFSCVAIVAERRFPFGVIFDFRKTGRGPNCLLIDKGTWHSRLFFLLLARAPDTPMSWTSIEQELPEITQLTNQLTLEFGPIKFTLTAQVVHPVGSLLLRNAQLDISVTVLA